MNWNVESGDDAEFESEIEAIVGALGTIEESDAIEVPATWKQTRTAMTQEKLTRNFPKPDLARLACRIRCCNSREVGISVGIVQRSASKHLEVTLACELFQAIGNCWRLPTSSQPTNHI